MSEGNAMVPVTAMTPVTGHNIRPGMLLIKEAAYGRGPYLTGSMPGEEDDPSLRFLLPLSEQKEFSYVIANQPRDGGIYLAAVDWELRVDPETSYTGRTEMPQAGDAFFSFGKPGLIGRWNYVEGYISLNGENLAEPDWTNGFVGFRSWSIVVKTGPDGECFTLLSHSRPKPERA